MRVVLEKHCMASRGGHTGLCLEANQKSRRIVDRVKTVSCVQALSLPSGCIKKNDYILSRRVRLRRTGLYSAR